MNNPTPFQLWSDGSVQRDDRAGQHVPGAKYAGGYAFRLLDHLGEPLTTGQGAEWTHGINCMELRAIRAGLQQAPVGSHVVIHSDSFNAVNWITGQFKAKSPQVIREVALIRDVIASRMLQVDVIKVPAHMGIEDNEWCDGRAKEVMRQLVSGAAALKAGDQKASAPKANVAGERPASLANSNAASPADTAPQAAPATPTEIALHFSASGTFWRANFGGRELNGTGTTNVDALCRAALSALREMPRGAHVRVYSRSINHVKWLKGEFKAKSPNIIKWLAQVQRVVRDRDLTLL